MQAAGANINLFQIGIFVNIIGICALEPEDETDSAIASFNKYVYNDKRVEVVILPIRDGVTVAWKF
jgi:predicted O-methyltransferase YrrM